MSTMPVVPPDPQAAPPATSTDAGNWWDLDPNASATPPESQAPAAEAPQAPPAAVPDQWFLRSDDGTIAYRTAEEAKRGLAEKDRYIRQKESDLARAQQLLASSGIYLDQQPPAPPQLDPIVAALENYIQQPAGQRKPAAVAAAVRQLVQQDFQSMLQPLNPLISRAAMSQAAEVAAAVFNPNIPAFVRSLAYARTMEQRPSLKVAIENAALYPEYHKMLPELLATAYDVAKAAAPAAAPVQRTAPQSTPMPQTFGVASPQGIQPSHLGTGLQSKDPFERAIAAMADGPFPSGSSD